MPALLECDKTVIMSHSAARKKGRVKAEAAIPEGLDPLVGDLAGYLLTERKRSPLTVAAYARDLKEFCDFLAEKAPSASLRTVGASQIRQYIAHLFDARVTTAERSAASSRRSGRFTGF